MKKIICTVLMVALVVFSLSEAVGRDQALDIAFREAGVIQSEASFLKAKSDRDDGRMIWEIEFDAKGYEYDIDVDQESGELIKLSYELKRMPRPQGGAIGKSDVAAVVRKLVPGFDESDYRVREDYDDGRQIYEIDVRRDDWIYELEVEATSGEVISFEKKKNDYIMLNPQRR